MKRNAPTKQLKKIMLNFVDQDPAIASVLPLFLYRGDPFHKLDFLAFTLNETPKDDPVYEIVKMIERLVSTPPSKEDWVKREVQPFPVIGHTRFDPAQGSPLYTFNENAEYLTFILKIEGYENASGDIQIIPTHFSFPGRALLVKDPAAREKLIENWWKDTARAESILWTLWEIYSQKIELTRLKKCAQCGKWFVDRTKNHKKDRCSARCTWQYWSWSKRKKANHDLSSQKSRARAKRKKKSKAGPKTQSAKRKG